MAEKEEEATLEVENIEATKSEENIIHTNSEYDELNDRYKRLFAEFENYKKRSQKERESLYNSILGDIIIGMLPAIDNLENAIKAECKDEKYKQGVELIQKQLKEFLNKNNIEEIKAEGQMFDPSVHEAVSRVQDGTKQSQEIVQEFRKGYKIGSRVLRHSMVIVAE